MIELEEKVSSGETLILPVTTIIETGNHIRHLDDGNKRRTSAEHFSAVLEATLENEAPWLLHQYTWGPAMLRRLIDGSSTGMTLVQHAIGGVGCGDLCILCERDLYMQRSQKKNVRIWTIDADLLSHC